MKHTIILAILALAGCITMPEIPKPKVDLPPITIPTIPTSQPDKPDAGIPCGCDLTKPIIQPPYTDAMLRGMGNRAECPVYYPGKDLRIAVMRPDGKAWLVGMLTPLLVTNSGNTYTPHCADADGGRYHYIGYSKSDLPRDIAREPSGTVHVYNGTMFLTWELRQK